ncbi:hypothetical protein ABZP36_035375 [Zizania latifolia]
MESNGGGGSRRLVVTQLSHIKELVKQLEVHLGGSPDLCKHLTSEISSVTERSIGMIIRSGAGHFDAARHRKRAAGDHLDSAPTPSPLSDVSDQPFKTTKKRKTMEKKKHQIRVSSAGGVENPLIDDGHSWRKYGQKEILGTKHPRGYYRCTHRHSQGCQATKQVQRTDEDLTLFDVIYHGEHTCVQKAVVTAAGKPQPERNTNAQSRLQDISSGLTVKTEGLQTTEPQQGSSWDAMPFCFSSPVSGLAPPERNPFSTPSTPENCLVASLSPSMVSPATSDSNYLCMTEPFQVGSDAEVVSTLVAVMSAPAPAMEANDLFVDRFEFDPSFPIESIDISSYFA